MQEELKVYTGDHEKILMLKKDGNARIKGKPLVLEPPVQVVGLITCLRTGPKHHQNSLTLYDNEQSS